MSSGFEHLYFVPLKFVPWGLSSRADTCSTAFQVRAGPPALLGGADLQGGERFSLNQSAQLARAVLRLQACHLLARAPALHVLPAPRGAAPLPRKAPRGPGAHAHRAVCHVQSARALRRAKPLEPRQPCPQAPGTAAGPAEPDVLT